MPLLRPNRVRTELPRVMWREVYRKRRRTSVANQTCGPGIRRTKRGIGDLCGSSDSRSRLVLDCLPKVVEQPLFGGYCAQRRSGRDRAPGQLMGSEGVAAD